MIPLLERSTASDAAPRRAVQDFPVAGPRRTGHNRRMDPSRAAAERELRALVAEIRAATESQLAKVEEAIGRLRLVLAQADARKAELERLLRPPAAAPAPEAPPDPTHAKVWSLQDAGLDPARIASETGLDAGEVSLILGLRRLGRPAP